MYKKLLLLSFVFTLTVSSGCTDTNPNKYKLADTWGADGNWSNSTSVAYDDKSEDEDKKETKIKKEPIASNKKENKKVEPNKIANNSNKKGPETQKHIENLPYMIGKLDGWEKVSSTASIKDYYVKVKDEAIMNFSATLMKTMGENDIKPKFKENYLKSLGKKFNNFRLVTNEETTVNSKPAWSLTYTFKENGTEIMQKQLFVPHSNNILVFNFTAEKNVFSKNETDFSNVEKNISFN
ncbi:MAG: DcrB-related protein [Candidatus Sericytochromatia bacterium]